MLFGIFSISPPRFLIECRNRRPNQGQLVVFIVFSSLGLLGFNELCIFLCYLVLLVR